ncbi:MAG: leucine-rich repeat domain-containing protein, partial [Ureaplasma sp.]|nr:leucine-rich repeat domain-containing protein [Ureaplasma sp.]
DLNSFIGMNQITVGQDGDINSYLVYSIFDFFKNVDTMFNGKLGQYINSPTNSSSSSNLSRSISVNLKSGLYKMISKNLQYNNFNIPRISVSGNSNIVLNDLDLSSPSSYFDISNTTLIGITSLGSKIKYFILPKKIAYIDKNAFNADNVVYLDLGITQITSIVAHQFDGTNITTLLLPNNFTRIETYAFWGMKNITTLTFPKTVNYIGHAFIWDCPQLLSVYFLNENTSGIAFSPYPPLNGANGSVKIYVKTSYLKNLFIQNQGSSWDSKIIIQ